MEVDAIREKLLEAIAEKPGSTKNELYYGHFEKEIGKFAPMYNVLRKLIDEGEIKVDGKKKNTGHYLKDAEIPEDVPKATSQPKSKASGAVHPFRKGKKAEGRFVVEKNEGQQDGSPNWKYSSDFKVKEASIEYMKNVSEIVPLDFRIRDQENNEVIDEKVAQWKIDKGVQPAGTSDATESVESNSAVG
jgi:hypothetical protein